MKEEKRKDTYRKPRLEIARLDTADVIATSAEVPAGKQGTLDGGAWDPN